MVPTNSEHLTETPSTGSEKTEETLKRVGGPSALNKDGVQGEGNYEAARAFNEAERKFVASGKVAAAADAAAPKSEAEREEMIAAEQEGKRRAKGQDPSLAKASTDAATPVPEKDADGKRE